MALVSLSLLSWSHRSNTTLHNPINCEICRVTEVGNSSFHSRVGGGLVMVSYGVDVAASMVVMDRVWVSWDAVSLLVWVAASGVGCRVLWQFLPFSFLLV